MKNQPGSDTTPHGLDQSAVAEAAATPGLEETEEDQAEDSASP